MSSGRGIIRGRVIALAIGGALLAASSGAFAAGTGADHGLRPIPGSFFVTLARGADRGPLNALLRVHGGELRYEYTLTPDRMNVRGVPPGLEVALARLPGVLSVTPDFEVHAHLAQSVTLIGAEPVVAGTDGGAGINVCVLDTGINPFHLMFNDIPSRLVAWKDFVNGGLEPYDDDFVAGHGSHVAGTVAGREGLSLNGEPFQGAAPRVNLSIGKVLNGSGFGTFSDVRAGIEWCAGFAADSPSPPADVINMSLGGGTFSEVCDSTDPTGTAASVNAAAAAGVLVVSAAGNEKNQNAVSTPACASGSMAIGATYDAKVGRISFVGCTDRKTSADRIACFSNHWDFLDVVAPGCIVQSADSETTNLVVGLCGTSQASPHVAGLAALVMAANPLLTAGEVRDCINFTAKDLGDPGFDRTYGNGRIQAIPAVACDTSCTPSEDPEVSCGDGLDNDCDGFVDGADPDCDAGGSCTDGQKGDSCALDSDCCSNKCKGKAGSKTCK